MYNTRLHQPATPSLTFPFILERLVRDDFLPLRWEMLKCLASRYSCEIFYGSTDSGPTVSWKLGKKPPRKKPNTEWHVLDRIVTSILEKSSSSQSCFSLLTGPGLKAKSSSFIIIIIIIIIILLKFKFNRFLNLHNPHIASLIEAGCVTYNKIHYKYITLQIHYIIVKCRKKYICKYIIIKIS